MKTIKSFILPLMLVLCTTMYYSCQQAGEKKNPKEAAEDMNEDKFRTDDSEDDAEVMVEAYSNSLFEVNFSNQAKTSAVTQDVKDLAAMMSSAHEKLNGKMRDLAAQKQITLPSDLTNAQKNDLESAYKKEGINYDKHYADEMVDKHKKSIERYEKASQNCKDADIKALFASALPELRSHLEMAQAVKDKIKDMKK
jgi:putative membrane protein